MYNRVKDEEEGKGKKIKSLQMLEFKFCSESAYLRAPETGKESSTCHGITEWGNQVIDEGLKVKVMDRK